MHGPLNVKFVVDSYSICSVLLTDSCIMAPCYEIWEYSPQKCLVGPDY
jgi:hypothetical protein